MDYEELEKRRLKIYLRHLLPIKEDANNIDVSNINFNEDCFIVSNKDYYREVFVLGLLALKRKVTYKVMSAYRLLDIMLEHDLEYKSFAHINEEFLLLTLGYDEMENKRQIDVINQVINVRRMSGRKTWLFYKGIMNEATSLHVCVKPVCIDKGTSKSSRGGRLI